MFDPCRTARILILCLWLPASQLAAAQPAVEPIAESQLKAAFLYRFAQFAEWPEEKFSSAHQSFYLCYAGSPEMDAALDIIREKKVLDAVLEIRKVSSTEQISSCHMLYLQAKDKNWSNSFIAESSRMNILTVSDQMDFAEKGGIIELVKHDNRIRFEINIHAADRAGIKLSAQLLKLATVVHENEQ